MSTLTANFPTASVRRSSAMRFTDGVVAGYIHALAASSRDTLRPQLSVTPASIEVASYAAESAEVAAGAVDANPGDAPRGQSRPVKGSCWSRGGRVSHSMRTPRVAEAR